ncbi:hypothetical protein EVJ58_g5639 [Rhodofomes roseus]|uniref:Uncharacterized protein n=1 Tax=Rhodofomes roseus TaxID=34475 RepID=A0A4Y9YAT8_9APHY|nr:hypothetical protein EVJ58_g5639 [Rhodofomes roseus]
MPTSSASSGSDSPAQPSGPETRPATPEPGKPTNNENATSSAGVPESGTDQACGLDYQAVGLGLERYLKDNNTGKIDEGADLIDIGGKETDTLRRNRLSPEVMEALQILKYLYKQERLNFAS